VGETREMLYSGAGILVVVCSNVLLLINTGYILRWIMIRKRSRQQILNIMARLLCFIYTVVITCLLIVPESGAEINPEVPVVYVDSIVSDEEEIGLRYPTFVLFEPELMEIYSVDAKARVIIYTHDFYPLFTIDKRHGVDAPQGLAVDGRGYVYVAQSPTSENPRSRISVFSPILRWERDIYIEGFDGAENFKAYRVAIDSHGNILVAGGNYPGVLVLDAEGRYYDIILPEEEGKLVQINNVNVKRGRIYLVSETKGRIYVYDENRSFLFAFGMKGGAPRHLSRPQSVDVDSTGRMFVVDYMRHIVAVYDPDGIPIFEFGGMGWGPGWFQFPKEVAIDNTDRIMVTDIFNNRIQVFRQLTPEELAELERLKNAAVIEEDEQASMEEDLSLGDEFLDSLSMDILEQLKQSSLELDLPSIDNLRRIEPQSLLEIDPLSMKGPEKFDLKPGSHIDPLSMMIQKKTEGAAGQEERTSIFE
jgi:hypothetical protein